MPYGTVVPVGRVAPGYPMPYDRVKYGRRPLGRLDPALDLARRPGFAIRVPRRAFLEKGVGRRSGRPTLGGPTLDLIGPKDPGPIIDPSTGAQTDGNRGFYIDHGRGLYGTNSYVAGVVVADGTQDIYAPTHMPANGSCIEITDMHVVYPNGTSGHNLGFVHWCDSLVFAPQIDMTTQDFQDKYVRATDDPISGVSAPGYTFQLVATGPDGGPEPDCWDAYLSNYLTGNWDQIVEVCGVTNSPRGNEGWTMWESLNLMTTCPSEPQLSVTNLQPYAVYNDDSGLTARFGAFNQDSVYSLQSGACWNNGNYTFASLFNSNGLSWRAYTDTGP